MNTYTKLRNGSWGVRVEGPAKAGDTVTVTKKSGETATEKISKVVWTGKGISLCSIEARTPKSPRARRRYDRVDCRKYGWDGVYGSPSYYSSGQYDEDS